MDKNNIKFTGVVILIRLLRVSTRVIWQNKIKQTFQKKIPEEHILHTLDILKNSNDLLKFMHICFQSLKIYSKT